MTQSSDQPPLDYATGPRRDGGGAWTGIVSVAIGSFGLLWLGGGWAYYLREAAAQAQQSAAGVAAGAGVYGAKVVLGLLVSATLPGTLVGLFLAVATRQRRPASSLGWVGLGLNTLTLLAGTGAILLMAFG